jgi:hypothetical protein
MGPYETVRLAEGGICLADTERQAGASRAWFGRETRQKDWHSA